MGICSLGTKCRKGAEFEETQINKSQFNVLYAVGRGGFGKVWKIETKSQKRLFAMKEMSKAKIYEKNSVESINNERKLLSQLRHPFIINMHYAFQDKEYLYLVLDFLPGGDLRYQYIQGQKFTQEQTKFFIACLALALDYIHSLGIIHRDIKPENLIFDDKGYLYLTDFGIAKLWKPNMILIDSSGTPGYMAPEVLFNHNHDLSSDYFAIGVLTYEFMYGKRPFLGKSRKEIKEQILSKEINITPSDLPTNWSIEAADFINKLLKRKSTERLGYGGIKELQEHSWLKGMPWDDLLKKQAEAPFKPKPGDNFDQKYCNRLDQIDQQTYKYYLKKIKEENYFKNFYYNFYDSKISNKESSAAMQNDTVGLTDNTKMKSEPPTPIKNFPLTPQSQNGYSSPIQKEILQDPTIPLTKKCTEKQIVLLENSHESAE